MEIFIWFSTYNIQWVLQFWAPFFSVRFDKTKSKKEDLDHVKNDQRDAVNHFHLVLKDSRMYVKDSIIFDIGRTRSQNCFLGSADVTGGTTLTIQAITKIWTKDLCLYQKNYLYFKTIIFFHK